MISYGDRGRKVTAALLVFLALPDRLWKSMNRELCVGGTQLAGSGPRTQQDPRGLKEFNSTSRPHTLVVLLLNLILIAIAGSEDLESVKFSFHLHVLTHLL